MKKIKIILDNFKKYYYLCQKFGKIPTWQGKENEQQIPIFTVLKTIAFEISFPLILRNGKKILLIQFLPISLQKVLESSLIQNRNLFPKFQGFRFALYTVSSIVGDTTRIPQGVECTCGRCTERDYINGGDK